MHQCLCAKEKKGKYLFDGCNTNVLGASNLHIYLPTYPVTILKLAALRRFALRYFESRERLSRPIDGLIDWGYFHKREKRGFETCVFTSLYIIHEKKKPELFFDRCQIIG